MTVAPAGAGVAPHAGRRIAAIDGLRAVAVLAVLVYHAGFGWLGGGLAGVDIFFVISGFVVTRSILADGDRPVRAQLAGFYARRLRRIAPALIVALLATTLAYCLFVPDAWLSDAVQRTALAAFAGFSNVALGSNGDTYFTPIATLNPFTHTWSLGVEEQFYLLLPATLAVAIAAGRHRGLAVSMVVVAALSALSLAACAQLSLTRPTLAFYSIATRGWELGIGVLLCLGQSWWQGRVERAPWLAVQFGVATCGVAVIAALYVPPGPRFPFPVAVVVDLATAGLIAAAVAGCRGVPLRVLSAAPVAAIGRASYSIYLWHWPLIVLMGWTVGLDRPPLRLIAVAGSLALGAASYRLVEQPTQRGAWFGGPARRRIGRHLLLLGAAALTAKGLLAAKHWISLSRTADRTIWYPGTGDRHVGPPPLHPVTFSAVASDDGIVRRFVPDHATGRQVFVIGDSHSLPYLPDMRRLAEETGIVVSAWFKPNCPFLPLHRAIRKTTQCSARFYLNAVKAVTASGHPGDVLFLPNLRLPRFVDQSGPVPGWGYDPGARAAATREAIALLRPVAARGVAIVFESPTPIFRIVPFRCADWYDRMNPACRPGAGIDRAALDPLRAPPLAQMRAVAAAVPGVEVWDVFDLLCPGRRCSAFRGNRPLFFDSDHLSTYGAALVYPELKCTLLAASRRGGADMDRRAGAR